MANCSDNTYVIRYTDPANGTISIGKSALVTDEVDIALVGKTRLEYGQIFNENILHLLERFACPEDSDNPGNPDIDIAYGELLERPVDGQFWYNSTQGRPYVYDKTEERWIPLGTRDDVGGNHGVIAHGQQIPRPVSPLTGYEFQYEECSWTVSPFNWDGEIDYLRCFSDPLTAEVTMEYRLLGEVALRQGYANYQIIGIRGNNNLGINYSPSPPPSPSAVVLTPTPTVSITPSVGTSPTPTPTVTPTPTLTPTITFNATFFAFEGSDIRVNRLDNTGSTSLYLWEFTVDNPSDDDTTPVAIWVNKEEGASSRYVAALYNRYLRVFSWNGSVLTQEAKVEMVAKNFINNEFSSEITAVLTDNLTSYAGNTSIKAIDFGTYYIFFVNDVGSYSETISSSQTRHYEASLQSFKFIKSGSTLTNNTSSFLPRFNLVATFPTALYSRAINAYDIRLVGSNIKVATANDDKEMIFQFSDQGSYQSTLAQVGDGVNGNLPTNTVMWYDNNRFYRGKTRDISDEGHIDYATFFNQSTLDGTDMLGMGIGKFSRWGDYTSDKFYFAEGGPYVGDTDYDRLILVEASTDPSQYLIMSGAGAFVDVEFPYGSLVNSAGKVAKRTLVDYLVFRTNKIDIGNGGTTINGIAMYSFASGAYTFRLALSNLTPVDFAFYMN